jgi:hypothetical protein
MDLASVLINTKIHEFKGTGSRDIIKYLQVYTKEPQLVF